MSDFKREIIEILKEDWTDERKADEIYRAAQDCFQPLDAEYWDG